MFHIKKNKNKKKTTFEDFLYSYPGQPYQKVVVSKEAITPVQYTASIVSSKTKYKKIIIIHNILNGALHSRAGCHVLHDGKMTEKQGGRRSGRY